MRQRRACTMPADLAAVVTRGSFPGPFGTPSGQGHVKLHQELRLRLKLFANVRLAKSVEGCPTAYDGVNLAIIRENTEGEYSGLEHEVRGLARRPTGGWASRLDVCGSCRLCPASSRTSR